MRVLVSVLAVIAVAAGTLSAVLWSDLKSERQLSAELGSELADARAQLAVRPVALPAPAAPEPGVAVPPPSVPESRPQLSAPVAQVVEIAKQQQTLLADSEYRKARLEQLRIDLRQLYAGFAQQFGISQQQMDRVIDIEAEARLRADEQGTALMADGLALDEAAIAELQREADEMQRQRKAQLAAVIGEAGVEQLQEYALTQPSRTRVTNLTNLLARGGQPLSDSQSKSLTRVIVAEQKRMDAETRVYAETGKSHPKSPADRQVETNRNILEASTGFLNSQQLELLRGRFQERATIDGASDRVQQREREVLQQQSGR